jgi:pimeloyl-ACP methyl ester carboxylesterase
MATFVLIPGAASDHWYWHLVEPLLQAAGHRTIAVDLPCDDDAAGFPEYADAVVAAIDAATSPVEDVILVAQSMGGFTAPIVATRRPVELIVLVAAMTPRPGESGGEWWENTGQAAAQAATMAALGFSTEDLDEDVVFLHDVAPDVIAASGAHLRGQSSTPFDAPWPLAAWPDVATRFLLCRDDRLFPADFQRRVVTERLGITPDEMDGGHLPALAHPAELARRLVAYANPR